MACQDGVYQGTATIRQQVPQLSKSQATVLALWSLGMVLARSCALSAVSLMLAVRLGRQENTVRQQLREFCYEAGAKRGAKRQALEPTTCFAPLLGWVLSWWQGTQVALALDATSRGDRFVVLALSVVYRGCAIPVAWTLLPAGQKHAWRGEWLRLLHQVWRVIPRQDTVIVLADRGLYARWLFRRSVGLGWHPFWRVNLGGTFRAACERDFRPLRSFVPTPGRQWQGAGIACKSKGAQLACTLLARWDAEYKDPWLILTDLPPEAADAAWYGLRAWIEQGFKITKRGGWQWQRTRMTDPQRAARLWLAVAVATLWLLSGGGEADATLPASTLPDVSAALGGPRRQRRATRLRLVSSFRRGCACMLAALRNQTALPLGRFLPEPWPASPAPEVVHHALT